MKRKGIWINDREFIQFSDPKISLSNEIATRSGAIDFYALGMYLPNPDPVLKSMGKDISVYKDLLTDGHLGGCITSRKSGVKRLEWEIDRGKAKSRPAKLVQDLFKNLDLDRIISEMLNAPLYGYQALEVIWEQVGPYWLPKDIMGKPQKWFVFDTDNQLLLRTRQNPLGMELPPRKFLLLQHDADYESPYGFPVLSRCFWPITFKKGGYKFWVTFCEKFGMPYLIGKQPRSGNPSEAADLANKLAAMVQDAVAVIPDDSSVEIMGSDVRGSSDLYDRLIQSCKGEISIAVLGQNLSTEVKGGSLAASESHMAVREDIVDGDKKLVERAFNTLIGWIFDLNFSGGERPVYSMFEEEDVDATLATRDKTLSDTGQLRFTKKYFQRAYGFEDDDIEIVEQSDTTPAGSAAAFHNGLKQAIAQSSQFAESVGTLQQDQIEVDTLATGSVGLFDSMTGPLLNIVDQATSYEDLQQRIGEAYRGIDMQKFTDLLQQALVLAHLKGRSIDG